MNWQKFIFNGSGTKKIMSNDAWTATEESVHKKYLLNYVVHFNLMLLVNMTPHGVSLSLKFIYNK